MSTYHDSFTAVLRQITFELRDRIADQPFVRHAETTLPGKDGRDVLVRYVRHEGLEVHTPSGVLRVPDEAWDQVGLVPVEDS